jgi:hypothetical protein
MTAGGYPSMAVSDRSTQRLDTKNTKGHEGDFGPRNPLDRYSISGLYQPALTLTVPSPSWLGLSGLPVEAVCRCGVARTSRTMTNEESRRQCGLVLVQSPRDADCLCGLVIRAVFLESKLRLTGLRWTKSRPGARRVRRERRSRPGAALHAIASHLQVGETQGVARCPP